MRTEKQIEASRINGRKSRGPLTAMGRDRIRTNALKHGLTARLVVWSNENGEQFQTLLLALLERFSPANDVEFLCVEEMAMAKWRQRRMIAIETTAGNEQLAETRREGGAGTLAAFTAAERSMQLLTTTRQHEAAFARAYQRAYRHLQQLRRETVDPDLDDLRLAA
jgi:hypothetical protein